LKEFETDPSLLRRYQALVLDELVALRTIDLGAVVTRDYLLDFLILYESLLASWTFYAFRLHAFAVEPDVHEWLSNAGLDHVEPHLIEGEAEAWWQGASQKISLVEHAGLERCIVTDVDNVFLAETPELFALLDANDFVFIGGPSPMWPIQTSLWSFRRNPRSIEFARRWLERSARRDLADASGLPEALMEDREPELAVAVLARPKPAESSHWHPSPYDVQANVRPFTLARDAIGFREAQMGRVKVLHLGALRAGGNESLRDRIDTIVERYPESAQLLPFYFQLARRAARRLGLEGDASPYAEERLLEAGILGYRDELPKLLNQRGLVGRGVEVGVKRGRFSELILRQWDGSELISVDPWQAYDRGDYVDASNVSQADQDSLHELAVRRLAPFGARSAIWRMTSAEAAARIEPQSLDFVYLDARHDYAAVKEDLERWLPAIRPGGVFAGHDYVDGDLPQGVFGVRSAVDEFFGGRGIVVKPTYLDAPWSSWVAEVPGSAQEEADALTRLMRAERHQPPGERDEAALARWAAEIERLRLRRS
jgi:hypothetical protein